MQPKRDFGEEAIDRARRAGTYALFAYKIITGSERSAKRSIAAGYISCAFVYASQAQSILLAHPETDADGDLIGYLGQFEDFVDAALAVLDGKDTIERLESEYSDIKDFCDKHSKPN